LIQKKHIIYYAFVAAIFILMKYLHSIAETGQLYFLLRPVVEVVSSAQQADFTYTEGDVFFLPKLNIVVDKSCSGFNFWTTCFLMLSFSLAKYEKQARLKTAYLAVVLAASFLFTLFANSARILFTLFTKQQLLSHSIKPATWLHEAEGSFVYLSFLVLIYASAEFALKKHQHNHAQFA
jgi:exosortase K